MKKIVTILFAAILLAGSAQVANAQAGGIIKKGKYVNWKFPDSIAYSKTVVFPTAGRFTPAWQEDSANVNVIEFSTWLRLDTLKQTKRVMLSTQSYITPGAQLVMQAVTDTGTRKLIIIQNQQADTISFKGNKNMSWYYQGSKFIPISQY